MKFRYAGEETYDRDLGHLVPGMEGEGPDDVVELKIRAGLLQPAYEGDYEPMSVEETAAPPVPGIQAPDQGVPPARWRGWPDEDKEEGQ